MKNLSKVLIAVLAILLIAPVEMNAAKKKKEKKPFTWELPNPLSGNADIDEYLLACDTLWNDIQKYSESMTTYTYKEDTLRNVNGADYVMAHMENATGEYLTRGAVAWQLVEAVTTGAEIVLDATNIGLQTAVATMALPELGMKAFTFGKYLKAGPKIIAMGGKEIKELATIRRAQLQSWKATKKDAVDAKDLGVWNEEQLKSLAKCCFIKKLDTNTTRELTETEKLEQEKLIGGLNITVEPEVLGQTLDDENAMDIDDLINEEQ